MDREIKIIIWFVVLIVSTLLFIFLSKDVDSIDDTIHNDLFWFVWSLVSIVTVSAIMLTINILKCLNPKNIIKR